jgi:serine/threonine-protein kinase
MAAKPGVFQFDRFECREYKGGGMTDVYRAWDTRLQREVALKILRPDASKETRDRFVREAQLACRCRHDNIVTTYEAGEGEGRPFLVMEWLEAKSAAVWLAEGGFGDFQRVLSIADQLAGALEYVHSLGIIHRDVKPANVCVDDAGRVRLIDFGIARTCDWSCTTPDIAPGTLPYMAPEQVLGKQIDKRVDIYAFGTVLYELVTGKRLVQWETSAEFFTAIAYAPADLSVLHEGAFPSGLAGVVQRCIEKDPAARFQNFKEVRTALAGLGGSRLGTARPESKSHDAQKSRRLPMLAGVAGAAIVAAGLVLWWMGQRRIVPPPPPQKVEHPIPVLPAVPPGMVLIESGDALLGADRHRMSVPAFYIDRTEVSAADYLRFCREQGRGAPEGMEQQDARLPAANVTFEDAQAYARWVGKRLPKPEEWEKAARGPEGRALPWGDTADRARANLAAEGQEGRPEPVDSRADGASPYGVLNLVGNVWEWVDAHGQPDKEQVRRLHDDFKSFHPPISADEPFVQIRGGSYRYPTPKSLPLEQWPALTSDFGYLPARLARPDVGFRCAMDVKP